MKYLITFLIFILSWSCSPTESVKTERLSAVQIVPKTVDSDFTFAENGIDAVSNDANDNSIRIMWYPHESTDLIQYFRIYRSEDPSGLANFREVFTLEVENKFNQDTEYKDSQLEINKTYFYYVSALDSDFKKGFPSDTVRYTLLHKPVLSNVQENEDEVIFNFEDSEQNINGYIFRMRRNLNNRADSILIHIVENDMYEFFGERQISHIVAKDSLKAKLLSNIEYEWRVDFLRGNKQFEGSESHWKPHTFTWGN